MNAAASRVLFPRWALHAAGGLLLAVLAAVAGLRAGGWSPAVEPGALVAQRSLQFSDGPGGAVLVTDAASGQVLDTMRGEQGFLRGVLRSVARDRKANGLPPGSLTLRLHQDGRFLLDDPQTGQRIDLASFGPDNAAVFLRWLPSSSLSGVTRP